MPKQNNGLTEFCPIAEENTHLQVLKDDEYLKHYHDDITLRVKEFRKWLQTFKDAEGGLVNVARSYKKFGLTVLPNGDINYREWAPAAKAISIFGEFNGWNREEFRCAKDEFGQHTCTLKANPDGTPRIPHNTKYKVNVEGPDGQRMDRNSAWSTYQVQEGGVLFDCKFWNPPASEKFVWTHEKAVPQPPQSDRIYEAHVGMAQDEGRVASYREFADYNLDRVKKLGYNVV